MSACSNMAGVLLRWQPQKGDLLLRLSPSTTSGQPVSSRQPQRDRYHSPWTLSARVKMLLWRVFQAMLFRPSPKALYRWRNFLLQIFGASLYGKPFVSQSAKIRIPWHLTMHDRACIGEHAEIYNLGRITLHERCTVAQHTYLCAGSHDFEIRTLPLVTKGITVQAEAFIGARALILPGVTIGEGCLIGAGSVVTKDTECWNVYAGNPARRIRSRSFCKE